MKVVQVMNITMKDQDIYVIIKIMLVQHNNRNIRQSSMIYLMQIPEIVDIA